MGFHMFFFIKTIDDLENKENEISFYIFSLLF